MGLDRPIDITADQRKTVLALLARHLPNTTAWVYGSRVKWTARPESDLDLVVFATPERAGRVSDLREAFDESNLPFRVDLFVWDDVPEQFRKQIEAEHVVLVEREEEGVAGDTATLRSLLIHTRDGEWGSANPGAGLVPIRVIRGTDFERVRRGDLTTVPIRYLRAEKSARKALKPGDILIETAGGSKGRPTGRTLLIQSRTLEGAEVPFTCASFARFLRVDEAQVNARYLYWFLQHLYQIGEMERHQVQHTGIARFQFTRFSEEIQVPLPPLPEQRHIAHILGMLDNKIELNRRMNQMLDEMARALFKSWFVDFDPVRAKATLKRHKTNHSPLEVESQKPSRQAKADAVGGSDWSVGRALAYLDGMDPNIAALFPDGFVDSLLGPIPAGWEVNALDELAVFQNGLALQKYRPQGDEGWLPVVKIAQLRTGKADRGEKATATIRPECIVDDGDVVFSWSGSLMVKVWCGGRAALNQHLFKVSSTDFPKWFFLQCIRFHLGDFQSIAAGKATTMGHIKRHHLSEAMCAVPNGQLLSAADGLMTSLLAKSIAASIQSRTLATLRDALLPKLVSGEVRVERV